MKSKAKRVANKQDKTKAPPGDNRQTKKSNNSNSSTPKLHIKSTSPNSDEPVDFVAQCHYKEIRYNFSSYEDFHKRLKETKRRSRSRLGSDLSSPQSESATPSTPLVIAPAALSATLDPASHGDHEFRLSWSCRHCGPGPGQELLQEAIQRRRSSQGQDSSEELESKGCECGEGSEASDSSPSPHSDGKTNQYFNWSGALFHGGNLPHQEILMLSAAERQELAENAMEQLASGLNKAAEAMQSEDEASKEEAKPDLANLQDKELFQLLEEAYSYKSKKDRQGKSEIFRELLEKAEENSSGEEQWDINFRKHFVQDPSSSKKKKKKVSESSKKGGSLSNLSLLSDSECQGGRQGKKKGRSSVSSRSREGGSLPPTKFENAVLWDLGQSVAPPPSQPHFAWDTGGKVMPGEGLEEVEPPQRVEQFQQRKSVEHFHLPETGRGTILNMEGQDEDSDKDSTKTEVEEIEMVEMEGREEESTPLLQARHRMETRGRVTREMAAPILAVQYDVDSSSGSIGVKVFQISPSSSSSSHVEKILQLPLTKEKTKTMSTSEMKQYKQEMKAYTNLEKKMKQRFVDMRGETPDNVIINLANGVFESSIKDGAQGFLKRDYPDIAEISPDDPRVGLTGANFVPMEWLSKHPGLVDPSLGGQKYQDAVSSNVLNEAQKRKRQEELRGYKGEGPEKAFYDEVKKYAAQTDHEFLLFHGVKFAKPGQGDQESDFVLVDRTLGAVVVTEVKASLNKTPDKDHPNGTLHNAVNQVDKIKVILEDWFGDLLKSFKFVGMVFGEVLEPFVTISPTCSPFVMVGAGEIVPKLINLKNELMKAGHTPATNAMDYRELAKYLLFAVHSNKAGAPVVSSMTREVEQRVVEAGSPHNIHYWSCWTPQQLGLIKSKGLRYVLLPSSMATGKTMCLIGKAIEKAEEGEKVLFIIFGYGCPMKTLLYYKLKSQLQSNDNIKIHYLNMLIEHFCIQELNALIQKYPGHSVFTDELVLPEPKYLSEVAKDVDKLRMELDKDTGPFRCLWITVAGGHGFTDADFTDARLASVFKQFFIVKMRIPLRGTKYVSTAAGNNKICTVDVFKSRVDVEIPSNLVEGIAPAIFTFDNRTKAEVVEAVRQAMDLVNREEGTRGVALLVDHDDNGTYSSWVAQGVVAAGRATPLQYVYSSSITEEDVELWLEGGNTRPDLITTARLSRGWEEAVVVTVSSGKYSGMWGPENMVLRCISRLITVRPA